MSRLPDLTRRRDPERPDCWYIYREDVRVGAIWRNARIADEART